MIKNDKYPKNNIFDSLINNSVDYSRNENNNHYNKTKKILDKFFKNEMLKNQKQTPVVNNYNIKKIPHNYKNKRNYLYDNFSKDDSFLKEFYLSTGDNIVNNKLQFSFIDLPSLENKDNNQFIQLLNFKIDNDPPKIFFNQGFKKFINLYENNNQLCIVDFTLKEIELDNNEIDNEIKEINLTKDNDLEIIPKIYNYSSKYEGKEKYAPINLLSEKSYYCSNSKSNEFLEFEFEKKYFFNRFIISYIDKYEKTRIKKFQISFLDEKRNIISFQVHSVNDIKPYNITGDLNDIAKYIRLDLLENFGGDYFCIRRIRFFADITYSIKNNE